MYVEFIREYPKHWGTKWRVDHLKIMEAIVRDVEDGFYYRGYVINSVGANHVQVLFNGKTQIVPKRFVMRKYCVGSQPLLSVGDKVLAYSKTHSAVGCYVPAIVIDWRRKSQSKNRVYTVQYYDCTISRWPIRKLVPITESKYATLLQHVKKAAAIIVYPNDPCQTTSSPRAVGEIHDLVEDIKVALVDNQQEQKEFAKTFKKYLIENKKANKDPKSKDGSKMKEKKPSKRDVGENTDSMTRDNFTNTGPMTRDNSTSISTPDQPSPKPIKKIPETSKVTDIDLNRKVLARCNDDGWYYRGTVEAKISKYIYEILYSNGKQQPTYREDIITDENDAGSIIQEKNTVVARHPYIPKSYAPGYVTARLPVIDSYRIRFFDNEEAIVHRLKVYKIEDKKYNRDIEDIAAKEKQWMGHAVVAGNAKDKHCSLVAYHNGTGNHSELERWIDAKESQHFSLKFGSYPKRRPINVDDFVLALLDEANSIYLPGKVVNISNRNLLVEIHDNNRKRKSKDSRF